MSKIFCFSNLKEMKKAREMYAVVRQCTISFKEIVAHCKGCNKFLLKVFSVIILSNSCLHFSVLPPHRSTFPQMSLKFCMGIHEPGQWSASHEKIPSKNKSCYRELGHCSVSGHSPTTTLAGKTAGMCTQVWGWKWARRRRAWSILG